MSTDAKTAPRKSLRRWTPRGVLALTMLFTGAAGLIYEYALSTVFSYLLGSSIEQFSITIGIMFFMMGVGGFLQSRLRGPLVEYFISAELVLVLLGGFSPIALQWAFAVLPDDFGWIKFIYTATIGMLIGIEIPLIMRINERFTKTLSSNIASTWAWDYVGGALGVIVWIWMLKTYVPITHISFWVAVVNLLVAVMSLVFFWRRGMLRWRVVRRVPVALITSVATIIVVLFGVSHVDGWTPAVNQKLYADPIIYQTTTKYQQIVLTEGNDPTDRLGKKYELFLNGNKQFSSVDEEIYHEYLVHPAMNLAAAHGRVLILGGGDGMALREVLKYPDVTDVTLVDLDPGMIDLATNHPVLAELNDHAFADARVHSSASDGVTDTGEQQDVLMDTGESKVTCEEDADNQGETRNDCTTEPVLEKVATVDIYTVDADRFISEQSGLYDVVIVDLPDPTSVELAKLYSQEFYAHVKRVMSPDGMVVVQATSPYHAKETFLCILRTMAAAGLNVLPYHDNVPSFGDWGWILGSPSLSADDLYDRADSMTDFGVPTSEVVAGNLTRALIFNKGWLDSDHSAISKVMDPVVLSYYTYEAWAVD